MLYLLLLVIAVVFIVALRFFYPVKYRPLVEKAGERYGVEPALIMAIINTESGFHANATSPRGAVGLMQLMPKTAEWIGKKEGIKITNLYNENENLLLGTAYFKYLLERFGEEKWAIIAYNAGEGNAMKWKTQQKEIPFLETRNYLERVGFAYKIYTQLL